MQSLAAYAFFAGKAARRRIHTFPPCSPGQWADSSKMWATPLYRYGETLATTIESLSKKKFHQGVENCQWIENLNNGYFKTFPENEKPGCFSPFRDFQAQFFLFP